ncbi:MAG: acyl-CoA ligase (AMP-forming), exosortase A system-associated [Pseudomonadota bacterium]
MVKKLSQFVVHQAEQSPHHTAIGYKKTVITYGQLRHAMNNFAGFLKGIIAEGACVGIYLPKTPESVTAILGTNHASRVFVPINPLLKPQQVGFIVDNCDMRVLVSTRERAKRLLSEISLPTLQHVIITDDFEEAIFLDCALTIHSWSEIHQKHTRVGAEVDSHCSSTELAALLYTSGSSGKPKGVMLSNQNLVVGALSVSHYLNNTADDRILAVLPFSFDYGLSQLTTALAVGASLFLLEYLLPQDVIKAVNKFEITGLAAVPPLWIKLANMSWPQVSTLRYWTNSGGAMPETTLRALQTILPETTPYLMYGLTEAFRSTYLEPSKLATKPDSIGQAIPNARVSIRRADGSEADVHETGELVHEGPLVSMGYWQSPELTQERFKPLPGQKTLAVWSGDLAYRDTEGDLYFVSRKDAMIKTSGYRVSPTEVEEAIFQHAAVQGVVAWGVKDLSLGQVIWVAVDIQSIEALTQIKQHSLQALPSYMQPVCWNIVSPMPRNANGKLDRQAIIASFS